MANTQYSRPWHWLSLPIGTPFENVAAYIFGPLKPMAKGHTHILVFINHHTRWVELIALPQPTAELVAEAIFEQWISRWGTMRALLTGNGRQFTARPLQQRTDVYGIKHIYSSPYNPRGNSVVESYAHPKDYAQAVQTGVSDGLGCRPASSRLGVPRHSAYCDGTHPVFSFDRPGSRFTAIG